MNKFIIIQTFVDKTFIEGNEKTINIFNVVRLVEAGSKDIAIQKFKFDTRNIKAEQKLNIECYHISELRYVS